MTTNLVVPAPETAIQPYTSPQNIADANGQDIAGIQRIHEEKWPQDKREEYYKTHPEKFAGPNLSFPIKDEEDVKHATALHGQANDKEKIKANIIRIVKELSLEHALPNDWKETPQKTDYVKEACIIESINTTGHCAEVTVMRGGKSINRYFYDEQTLQTIARLVEGAHAYTDHGDAQTVTRDVRDLVGFYKNAQYIPPAQGQAYGKVIANLHILEAADWLWSIIQESQALGQPNLIGLSIDIFGKWQHDQSHDAKAVTQVISLNSCDIVTRPSAGGSINRILHNTGGNMTTSIQDPPITPVIKTTPEPVVQQPQTGQVTPTTTIQEGQQANPTLNVQPTPISTDHTDTEFGRELAKQQKIIEAEAIRMREQQKIMEAQRAELALIKEQQLAIAAQRTEMEALLTQTRLDRAQTLLNKKLQESILPIAVQSHVREKFTGRVFEEAELDKEMNAALTMLADLTRAGIVRGHGFEKPEIGSQITESEKVQAAFDAMFDLDIDRTKYGNVKPFTSIRDAYARVTGESSLHHGIRGDSQLGPIPISESAPIARISEADTTTASFSYLLGTSMNKRLLKDYQAWPAEWMKFCTIAPIRDYKQQTRVRLGAFGSLAIVPEDGAYNAVTLTDSAATYVAQKRGNLVTVSRETIINDDLQSIKQIPTKLAVAAAYTLAEFVYAFLSANPTIYDGSALFLTGSPHTNLGTSALSTAAMQSGVTAMREQTNFASKRLGLRPKYLVVPPELEFVAMVVTKSAGVPGSNNNDINPMLGYVTPIVSPQLTNTTQWFLIGNPREIDTIEIGFVGGQVNPALFIQDQPLFGSNFTSDLISYKCRHEYGGVVTDFRGLYRGI